MAKPKQQHVVPQSYLEFFCDPKFRPQNLIWMTDLETGRIVRSQPASVAKRSHYYSVGTESGQRTDIEEMLSAIESEALPILRKLAGWDFALTQQGWATLSIFLSAMMHRVPKMRDRIEELHAEIAKRIADILFTQPGALESSRRRMQKDGVKAPDFTPDEMREWYAKYGDKLKITANPAVSLESMVRILCDIADVTFRLTPSMVVNTTAQGFVTSDNPVVMRNPRLIEGTFWGSPGLG